MARSMRLLVAVTRILGPSLDPGRESLASLGRKERRSAASASEMRGKAGREGNDSVNGWIYTSAVKDRGRVHASGEVLGSCGR